MLRGREHQIALQFRTSTETYNGIMGGRLLQWIDFFIERPPLTGALVCGALYLLKRSRKPHLSDEERQHALDLSAQQRTYAEKMYDPPRDDEQSASVQRK